MNRLREPPCNRATCGDSSVPKTGCVASPVSKHAHKLNAVQSSRRIVHCFQNVFCWPCCSKMTRFNACPSKYTISDCWKSQNFQWECEDNMQYKQTAILYPFRLRDSGLIVIPIILSTWVCSQRKLKKGTFWTLRLKKAEAGVDVFTCLVWSATLLHLQFYALHIFSSRR